MGCSSSKEEDSEDVGGKKNRYMRPERDSRSVVGEAAERGQYGLMNDYESDSRCPLTDRQLYSILKSWKAISRDMVNTAVNMFVRLLETEEIRSFFSRFNQFETIAELRASKLFQEHALMVISTIDEVITNLDDMDYVINLLQSTGESHSIRFQNFNPQFFWKVEAAFLWSVKDTLGDRYTISIENVYTVTIRFILQTLHDSFRAHRSKQTTTTDQGNKPTGNKPAADIIEDNVCENKSAGDPSVEIDNETYKKKLIDHKEGATTCEDQTGGNKVTTLSNGAEDSKIGDIILDKTGTIPAAITIEEIEPQNNKTNENGPLDNRACDKTSATTSDIDCRDLTALSLADEPIVSIDDVKIT